MKYEIAMHLEQRLLFNPQSKEYFAQINEENNLRVDTFVSELAKKENINILDYRLLYSLYMSYLLCLYFQNI